METVSIVVPFHNHGAYVDETLASVQAQTYPAVETVIVDDGSTDPGSIAKLESLRRAGWSVMSLPHGGPSKARNHGIRHATGTYILPLDSDDLLSPSAVQELVDALERTSADVAIPDACYFGLKRGPVFLAPWDRSSILVSNAATCTALFRKSRWEEVGGYNENMTEGYEDWDFWMSFIERGFSAVQVGKALFHYRIKSESRNPTPERILSLAAMHARMIQNHPSLHGELPSLLAAYYRARHVTWQRLLWRRVSSIGTRLSLAWLALFPAKPKL